MDDNMLAQLRQIRELPSTQPDEAPDLTTVDPDRREQRNALFEELYARRDQLDVLIYNTTREHQNCLDDIEQLNHDEHAERHLL
jgi:short-subunit dehydrogenase